MRKKLAFNIISGNEEKWVEQFCRSILKAKPDYVVINLTQYDDKTEDLFKKLIPSDILTLVKYPWTKSFSEARNHCLEHTPDDADYIFYIDMDEEFVANAYPIIESILNSNETIVPLVTIYNTLNQDSDMQASLYYPRMFPARVDGRSIKHKLHFDGTVHNQLIFPQDEKLLYVRTGISIMHYGYALSPEEMLKKHQRSEELLRGQLAENYENFFAHLNLAQLLRARGDMAGTEKHAREVLRIVAPSVASGNERYFHAVIMAEDQLATACFAQGKIDEAIAHSEKALEVKPDHLDSIINLGTFNLEKRDFDKAEFWYSRYLFIRSRYNEFQDNTNLILNHLNSGFLAYYNLGVIQSIKGNHEKALGYYKKAYGLEPTFRDAIIKYAHTLRIMGKYSEMYNLINSFVQEHPKKAFIVYDYLGMISMEEGNIELAKFNFYQAANLIPKEYEEFRLLLLNKLQVLTSLFGELSQTFFSVENKATKVKELVGD